MTLFVNDLSLSRIKSNNYVVFVLTVLCILLPSSERLALVRAACPDPMGLACADCSYSYTGWSYDYSLIQIFLFF
jgi:hypothetical protein